MPVVMEASSRAFVVNSGKVVTVVHGGGEEEKEIGEKELGGEGEVEGKR